MNDTLENTLDQVFGEDAWYEPSENGGSAPQIAEGKYTATVTDLTIKEDIVISGKFLADIYEPVFMIDGREVRHKGMFRFKKPDPAKYPQLQTDMGSNSNYYKFCDMLGITKSKDGKMFLPTLDVDTLKKYEYEVVVVVESWTGREGNEMKTPRVKFVNTAKKTGISESDLPF